MTGSNSSGSFLGDLQGIFTNGLNAVVDAEVSHIASPDQGQPSTATPPGQAPAVQGTANAPGFLANHWALIGGAAAVLVLVVLLVRR